MRTFRQLAADWPAAAIFTGVGLGIVVSGTLVPALSNLGLVATWQGLGGLSLALTVLAWAGWPQTARRPAAASPRAQPRRRSSTPLRALYVEYGLSAVGLVPHMVFLVDFTARGLGQGLAAGARYWVIFGLGAVGGPLLAGLAADRIGFRPALRLVLLVQAAAIALVALTDRPVALMVSSAIVGAFVPGVVPLALGRVQELISDDQDRKAAWSQCTVAFAVGQAGAAYAFSYLFAQTGGAYRLLFAAGAVAMLLALAIDLVSPRARRPWKP